MVANDITGRDSARARRRLLPNSLEQDLQRSVRRAAARQEIDSEVKVDVGANRDPRGRARLVPATLELLGTPPLDPLGLGLDEDL
jgi:hypothetical protein